MTVPAVWEASSRDSGTGHPSGASSASSVGSPFSSHAATRAAGGSAAEPRATSVSCHQPASRRTLASPTLGAFVAQSTPMMVVKAISEPRARRGWTGQYPSVSPATARWSFHDRPWASVLRGLSMERRPVAVAPANCTGVEEADPTHLDDVAPCLNQRPGDAFDRRSPAEARTAATATTDAGHRPSSPGTVTVAMRPEQLLLEEPTAGLDTDA